MNAMPTANRISRARAINRILIGRVSHLNQDSFFPKKTLKRAMTGAWRGANKEAAFGEAIVGGEAAGEFPSPAF